MSEDKTRSQDPELLEHYAKQQQSFDEVKAAYAERGLLMNVDLGKREGEAQMLVSAGVPGRLEGIAGARATGPIPTCFRWSSSTTRRWIGKMRFR